MALSARARRRRLILAALIGAHVVALWLYAVRERQADYLGRVLDAREQWSQGNLALAADLYRGYATDYPEFAWPVVLFRNYPTRPRAWYSLGRIEADRGNVDAALAAFRSSMAGEPGLGQREYRNLLLEQGRYRELVEDAHRRLAADPDDLSGWWDEGAAQLGLGDARAASLAYAEALAHLPRWLERHTRAGAGGGLTVEEAELAGLLSVAALEAGNAPLAAARCSDLARRERRDEHYDQLCAAYLAAGAGDSARARALLGGYRPPAPEHARLAEQLARRLATDPSAAR